MADIGYRRKGDSTPMYNPERDYAYITPTLMRQAIETLDANNDADRARWRAEQNITDQEVVDIAVALAEAQRDFINAADPVASFDAALNRRNFFNFRYGVRQYLWAAIGEVFCAAWFLAVREVSVVGEDSPTQVDMARFTAAVREFAGRHKSSLYDANFMAEHLQMVNDTMRARESELLAAYRRRSAELEKLQAVNQQLQEEVSRLKNKSFTLFGWFREKTDYTGMK
jgi:hypothetical protein